MLITGLLATLAATFAAFTALWTLSLRRADASIVDFYWGPGFVVIGWMAFAMAGSIDAARLILLMALTLWGLRLGWYMRQRHRGQEDARYAAMRQNHGADFGRKSLWLVFWLQAFLQWLAASPILVAAFAKPQPVWPIMALGLALFSAGFLLEILADRAVARFKSNPANRGKLLTSGLHARIRHPNYLGEIILQWGFGVMAFGLTLNPLAFMGPALMHVLIVRLSGVPMLEQQLAKRAGFQEWQARSGALWWR